MATRRTATTTTPSSPGSSSASGVASETQPLRHPLDQDTVSEWITRALDEGVRPEQALAFIGLGLMRRMGGGIGDGFADWKDDADADHPVDLAACASGSRSPTWPSAPARPSAPPRSPS
jgi:hypothetical protein